MDLWIRNAGKTLLLKANEIYINPMVEYEEKGVVMCSDLFDLDISDIDIEKIENKKFGVYADKRILVATYSTKEKALEVLDEIQKFINHWGSDQVYQMPADNTSPALKNN